MEISHEIEPLCEGEQKMFRDTLVYALGKTAEVLLRRAFSEAQVRAHYAEWVACQSREADQGRQLVVAGVGDGVVQLVARGEKEEFLIRVQHPNFNASIPLGFDPARDEFIGFVLAEFTGSMPIAIQFARTIAKSIEQGDAATFPRADLGPLN
jgi:hypothetical protein